MESIWLVPLALGAIGLAIFSAAALVSHRFDRIYPHLSRKGLHEAEEREKATRAAVRRVPIPIPPFNADKWRMQAIRDESETERLDRSLTRWGERVSGAPKQQTETRASSRR